MERSNAEGLFALAFAHHLAIAKNIPLDAVIAWIVELAPPGVYCRVLFNAFLGTDLPLLPEMVYLSSFDRPFAFIDVTETTAPGN